MCLDEPHHILIYQFWKKIDFRSFTECIISPFCFALKLYQPVLNESKIFLLIVYMALIISEGRRTQLRRFFDETCASSNASSSFRIETMWSKGGTM